MFEESKVGAPDMLQFVSRIPTGISHAMGNADGRDLAAYVSIKGVMETDSH